MMLREGDIVSIGGMPWHEQARVVSIGSSGTVLLAYGSKTAFTTVNAIVNLGDDLDADWTVDTTALFGVERQRAA